MELRLFVFTNVDKNNKEEAKEVLAKFKKLAEELECAVAPYWMDEKFNMDGKLK